MSEAVNVEQTEPQEPEANETDPRPMTGRPLLEAVHLDAVRFASKDPGRYQIQGVHVAPDGTVAATNGHYLVKVEPSRIPQEEAPETTASHVPDAGVILEPDAIKAASRLVDKKATIPICKCVQVNADSLSVPLSGSVTFKPIASTFPSFEHVIPEPTDETHVTIGFNAAYLAEIAAYAAKHGKGGRIVPLCLSVPKDPSQPMRADFETESGVKVVMVVMPVKL